MIAGANRSVGYRGYIGSRPIAGERTAQHVQNLVVRDYAQRMGFYWKLSAVEYAMPGCYMMLESLIDELPSHEGIICFSINMLPERPGRRCDVYSRVFAQGGEVHTALEGLAIRNTDDAERVEEMLRVKQLLPTCPTSF